MFPQVKKWIKVPNLVNGVVFIAFVILMVNPSAKAMLIRGLMKVGLFQPRLSYPDTKKNSAVLPDVIFESADGRIVHLANLKGKVIFLNFWATWCPPCIAEMPSINSLYEKLKTNKNIVFIIADADRNFQKSKPFMARHHFTMPLYQAASTIPESFLSHSIPTTTIIDRQGKVVFHQEGSADYSNPRVLQYLKSIIL